MEQNDYTHFWNGPWGRQIKLLRIIIKSSRIINCWPLLEVRYSSRLTDLMSILQGGVGGRSISKSERKELFLCFYFSLRKGRWDHASGRGRVTNKPVANAPIFSITWETLAQWFLCWVVGKLSPWWWWWYCGVSPKRKGTNPAAGSCIHGTYFCSAFLSRRQEYGARIANLVIWSLDLVANDKMDGWGFLHWFTTHQLLPII